MVELPFIFSNQFKWRLSRHLCFWMCWYVFQVYLYSFAPTPLLTKVGFGTRILITAPESFFFLFPHIFLSYSLMYGVIPKLIIPAKYGKAVISILLLILITAGISAFLSLTIIDYLRQNLLTQYASNITQSQTPLNVQVYLAWISGLRGSITIGGLAAAIKLMKHFYKKQQQALVLEQEKTVAELQSLKSQLHPHFLFNTLNNIYAHTQDTAPEAADMLLGLSSLLRYMLYTCNAPLVPLAKEISMIMEYIELEKKRYGNELDVSIQTPVEYRDLLIAPLLLLPFVENCFKHGTSGVLEHPWINMHINLDQNSMHLKLVNGKAITKKARQGGIGIENVRRRLSLLYPDKHQLSILEEDEMYIVNLQVDLTLPDTNISNHKLTREIHEFKHL